MKIWLVIAMLFSLALPGASFAETQPKQSQTKAKEPDCRFKLIIYNTAISSRNLGLDNTVTLDTLRPFLKDPSVTETYLRKVVKNVYTDLRFVAMQDGDMLHYPALRSCENGQLD